MTEDVKPVLLPPPPPTAQKQSLLPLPPTEQHDSIKRKRDSVLTFTTLVAERTPGTENWNHLLFWGNPDDTSECWIDSHEGRQFGIVVQLASGDLDRPIGIKVSLDGIVAFRMSRTPADLKLPIVLDSLNVSKTERAPMIWGTTKISAIPQNPSTPYNLAEQTKHLGMIVVGLCTCVPGPVRLFEPQLFKPKEIQAPEHPEKRALVERTPAVATSSERLTIQMPKKECYLYTDKVLYALRIHYGPAERRPARFTCSPTFRMIRYVTVPSK